MPPSAEMKKVLLLSIFRRMSCILWGCHCLGFAGSQTLPPIIGDRAINDRSAVNAFPGIEYQEEIGEPLEHHEAFALRTFHRILQGCGELLLALQSKYRTIFCLYVISTV
jgi:hypothetical protein